MYGPRISIYIHYYNDEHILKSSLYKKLQKIAFCRCCPYDSPWGKTFYRDVFGFFQFDFTKKYEYVKSLWNEGMIHTPTIPPHFKHDEHIIIKVWDPFGNIILFKLYLDVPLEILCIYFANRVGIDDSVLGILLHGRRIAWDDTPRRLELTNNDIFQIVCAQYG
uniref:Ubiquitin-like domain-containing protein n=1 Tax=Panagrolaimus davidi TaxID=227884 RepID=A0A914PNW5_9BILA